MWSQFNTTMSTSGWVCQRRSLMNNLRLVLTVAPNYASHSLSVWNDGYSFVLQSVLSFIHASIHLLHFKKSLFPLLLLLLLKLSLV